MPRERSDMRRVKELLRLAHELGYATDAVRAAPSQIDANRAPRHKQGVILVDKARTLLHTPLLGLEDTIRLSVQGKNL